MPGPLRRGLVAGAAGTAVLNAVTYADMAVRGRPGSDVPSRTVQALAHLAGRRVPGRGQAQEARTTALGALVGTTSGLTVGVAAALARAAGFRGSRPVGALATAAGAMALTDAVPARLGVTDLATWSPADWAADALPHLAFGITTDTVLRAQERPEERRPRARASAALLARSAALGAATGSRSSMGLSSVAARVGGPPGRGRARLVAALVVGELTVDLLPVAPSRLEASSLAARVAAGAGGGVALADAHGRRPLLPALVGATSAVGGALLGTAFRDRTRLPNWQAGLAEDVVALGLASVAVRRPGR